VRKLLIADDEAAIRLIVRTTLGDDSFEILEAADGEEALEVAREHRPQLILLDVMMPKRSGFEVCRALKADPETSSTRIIILSGKSQESEKRIGAEVGADDYFTKPFSPIALLRKIDEAFSESRETRPASR
jgi:DNA-binding response OmpR family regulator